MKKKKIYSSLLAIAAANPSGFTVNFNDLAPVATGYAVAVAATQNSFGEAGLRRVIDFVAANAPAVSAFGGWLDQESGLYYWDATIICSTREEAERLARANNQIAFFHLDTLTEIRVEA